MRGVDVGADGPAIGRGALGGLVCGFPGFLRGRGGLGRFLGRRGFFGGFSSLHGRLRGALAVEEVVGGLPGDLLALHVADLGVLDARERGGGVAAHGLGRGVAGGYDRGLDRRALVLRGEHVFVQALVARAGLGLAGEALQLANLAQFVVAEAAAGVAAVHDQPVVAVRDDRVVLHLQRAVVVAEQEERGDGDRRDQQAQQDDVPLAQVRLLGVLLAKSLGSCAFLGHGWVILSNSG